MARFGEGSSGRGRYTVDTIRMLFCSRCANRHLRAYEFTGHDGFRANELHTASRAARYVSTAMRWRGVIRPTWNI
jgi:hypothetical protein